MTAATIAPLKWTDKPDGSRVAIIRRRGSVKWLAIIEPLGSDMFHWWLGTKQPGLGSLTKDQGPAKTIEAAEAIIANRLPYF